MGALESWRIASFATKWKFAFAHKLQKNFKAGFDQNKTSALLTWIQRDAAQRKHTLLMTANDNAPL